MLVTVLATAEHRQVGEEHNDGDAWETVGLAQFVKGWGIAPLQYLSLNLW